MTEESEGVGRGLMEGVIEALSDKHSQLDVRLQNLTLALGDTGLHLRLSGTVSVAVHMRELTDAEKDAHATANIAKIQT